MSAPEQIMLNTFSGWKRETDIWRPWVVRSWTVELTGAIRDLFIVHDLDPSSAADIHIVNIYA